jgi:hypothetical protein
MDGHPNQSNGPFEKPTAPGGCSELIESLHACSRSLKDHLPHPHPSTSPDASSSSRSSANSSTIELLSRKTKIRLQGILAESLDHLLAGPSFSPFPSS